MTWVHGIFGFFVILGLAWAIAIYAMVLIPTIWGIVRLRRHRADAFGWILVGVGLAPVAYYGSLWVAASTAPSRRAAEIALWPRVTVADKFPRVLIIRDASLAPEPFAYFLAETGLFDVYVVPNPRLARQAWYLHVEQRDDCRKTRRERAEMLALTLWRACAVAVPTNDPPTDGLVLYRGVLAPHSWWSLRKDFATQAPWTLELALHEHSDEKLINFDEFVGFRVYAFHPLVGPYSRPRDPPRRLGYIAAPEPADFVLASLGVDERSVKPPFMATPAERDGELGRLIESGSADDVRIALDVIAAREPDLSLKSAMFRLAANPATSRQMNVGHQHRWCEKISRLMKYRDELAAACSVSGLPPDQCGQLTHSRGWLESCADNSVPIWRDRDGATKRVFIADVGSKTKTSVVLRGPAGLVDVRVPPDRGMIDLVVRTHGWIVFSVTGAVSCLQRLTVLEDNGSAVGVSGVDPDRVRFMSPVGAGSWIDPNAPYSRDIARILGVEPDVLRLGHVGPIDLGELLPKPWWWAPRCEQNSISPVVAEPRARDDGVVEIKGDTIVTAPPLVPRNAK